MASTIINTGVVQGITLGPTYAYDSPLTITSTGGVTSDYGAAIYGPTSASITNSGIISATGAANYYQAIYLKEGGSVTNTGGQISSQAGEAINIQGIGYVSNIGGLIEGQAGGVAIGIYGAAGTVVNSGNIIGDVILGNGGTVSNTGQVEGYVAVSIAAGTITNTGTGAIVSTTNNGVYLRDGGTVTNTGSLIEGYGVGVRIIGASGFVANTGTIASTAIGGTGIFLGGGGTVFNSGMIDGASTAIYFGGSGATNNRLSLTPGQSLIGSVVANNAANNTLELGSAAGIGTLTSQVIHFDSLVVDTGAKWVLTGVSTIANDVALPGGNYLKTDWFFYSQNGISSTGGPSTVVNFGSVGANGVFSPGIYLETGGTITNIAGTITGQGGFAPGAYLKGGGAVSNLGGLIQGQLDGLLVGGGTGIVVNSGTITGGVGVKFTGAADTLTDSGTIIGSGGTAVSFGVTTGNRLVLEQGYLLNGTVSVSGTANTLELSGYNGSVDVSFNSHGFTGFDTVLFDVPGSNTETLTISNTVMVPGTIVGFTQYRDIINLTQIDPTGAQVTQNGDQLLVANDGGQQVTLQLDADYSGVDWRTRPDGSGTDLYVACYCRGTLIRTANGDMPVEELAIGDKVITLFGGLRAIKWIGRRAYSGRFVKSKQVLPICVTADALGNGIPSRDLWLSPWHALYVDGLLAPAWQLVNGVSIVQAAAVDEVEYFHIELQSHDVIFAEDAPAETYVDCDNRRMFHNAEEFAQLYPGTLRSAGLRCAPLLDGPSVRMAAIHAALKARAASLSKPVRRKAA